MSATEEDEEAAFVAKCQNLKTELQDLCEAEGLTLEQVFWGGQKAPKQVKIDKYRNPNAHDFTWDGQGKAPDWFQKHITEGGATADVINPNYKE